MLAIGHILQELDFTRLDILPGFTDLRVIVACGNGGRSRSIPHLPLGGRAAVSHNLRLGEFSRYQQPWFDVRQVPGALSLRNLPAPMQPAELPARSTVRIGQEYSPA